MSAYRVTPVAAVEASGPGALAGFEARCECGLVMRSSLRSALDADVAAHDAWHMRQAAEAERLELLVPAAKTIDEREALLRRASYHWGLA